MPRIARPQRPLTDDDRRLVADNLRLAWSMAGHWTRTSHPKHADLYRDAAVDGLVRAARLFDPARPARPSGNRSGRS